MQIIKRLLSAISVVTLLCCGLIPIQSIAQGNVQPPALNKEQWREDLPYFAKELPKRHVSFRGYNALGENARKLLQFLDGNPTKRLVIDLRQKGGGDFFEGRKHLIQPLKEHPALNQKGHLFVIVGRATFSAAMTNAIDFRKQTNAILVGEPIGERPNSYSENDEMTLPNSRLVVSDSTRYYKFLEEEAPVVLPDKRIDPNWAHFQAGRDPVMDWILSASSKFGGSYNWR